MKKRGLSNIIATILIILLALAAIVVMGKFFLPGIEKTGASIDLKTKCLSAEVKPSSCAVIDQNATVIIQRIRGDVSKVMAIVEDENGKAESVEASAPNILETASVNVNVTSLGTTLTAKAAAIVSDNASNEETCGVSTVTVSCG